MAQPYTGPNLGPLLPAEGAAQADPYAQHFGDAPPADAPSPAVAQQQAIHDQAFGDTPPPDAPALPGRETDRAEAGVKGVGNALTFGASPAIAGLAEASGIPSAAEGHPGEIDINPVRPIVGAAKLLHNWLSEHPDQDVKDAYERGRQNQLHDEKLSLEQHPVPYIMGQLGGALMVPLGAVGAAGKAATTAARVGRGAGAGAVGGGLYGAGGAIGEDKSAGDVALDAGKGVLTGAAFGTAATAGGAAIGKGFDKAASVFRGARDVEAEAGRRVAGAVQSDLERGGPALTREEIAAANQAGVPRAIVDTGGENTRALARSSANTSPEGRQALTEFTQGRFEEQAPRVSGFIRQITGGANAAADNEALHNAARLANKPAYDKLMNAHPVVSVPSSISDRPVIAQAMKDAVSLAKNHGEKIQGETELKTILKGPGYHIADDVANPAKTSLRYWDYVKKALDARIEGMKKSGGIDELNSKEVADFRGLVAAKTALVEHLDAVAPNYKATREGAAAFFKAENALEAGQNFVMSNANIHEARLALAKMSAPEKELFARGFASDLADKIASIGDNRSILNSAFVNNGPAREKIVMALGPARARQLEALLRVEKVVDFARKAVSGNSTTIRQNAESGLAGGGAVATYEGLKEHEFNPVHVLTAALTFGAIRHGAQKIDSRTARRVGEMLASNDPSVLTKGIKIVTSTPSYIEGLRRATASGVRVGAYDVGPDNAAAGAATLGARILEGPDRPANIMHPSDAAADAVQ